MSSKAVAAIYAHSLLGGSMTFIKSHAEALTRYLPIYVGSHRVQGLDLPEERTYVLNNRTPLGLVREYSFRKWGWAPGFVRQLGRRSPKVLHAHFGTAGPTAMLLARQLNVPFVVTFHGKDATMKVDEAQKSRRGRDMLRRGPEMIREASAFIAVSDYIRQRLLEKGYPEEKLILHYNGIDLDFFRPSPNIEREPLIVFVGRFVEKKGARYLIEAAHELCMAGVEFELVMIGGGPLDSELERMAQRTRLKCRFEGFLELEEIVSWLNRAAVVAIPSVTAANGDAEGLPTVLLEAQAMETPVVATYHSGIPEGVIDGTTGYLVGERDVSALAHRLRSLLESPSIARAFGEAGRRFVRERFDLRTQVQGLEAIYSDVSARRADCSPFD